jgi:hypothetical protein
MLTLALAQASTNAFAASNVPPELKNLNAQPLVDAVKRAYPDWDTAKGIQVPLDGTGDPVVNFYTPRGHISCRIGGPPPRLVHCRSLKD